nr:hypothetical protein [Escherichia coli]
MEAGHPIFHGVVFHLSFFVNINELFVFCSGEALLNKSDFG